MDISNLGNLSVKEWIEILGEHPELEEKCDKFNDFSDFDWLALWRKPLFSKKFDEYRANYANTWVQILKTSPERASECDCWKEIAKCAYRGFVKTEYLALFAMRTPEILAFVESESPELKQEVLGNIDRIKNSEALKFLLKTQSPCHKECSIQSMTTWISTKFSDFLSITKKFYRSRNFAVATIADTFFRQTKLNTTWNRKQNKRQRVRSAKWTP